MKRDEHKLLDIEYNHLNLPKKFIEEGNLIEITYDAAGVKLTKKTTATDGAITIRHYVGGIEYTGDELTLDAIYHSEGRVVPLDAPFSNDVGSFYFRYEYTLTDHLGNGRAYISDSDFNGELDPAAEVLQQAHYYPFGMNMKGLPDNTQTGQVNPYQYNGLFKDGVGALSLNLNEDFGLNLSDYGARWYDAAVARWCSVDPLAEDYVAWSGYNYVMGNPVRYIDPDGMRVEDDYGVDKNGNISLLRKTDDEKDKLIVLDENGTETNESIEVEKGILDKISHKPKNQPYGLSYFSTANFDQAEKLFEFLAINTEVEWGMIVTEYATTVGTYHTRDAIMGLVEIYQKMYEAGARYEVFIYVHSHPSHLSTKMPVEHAGPSGYDKNDTGGLWRIRNKYGEFGDKAHVRYIEEKMPEQPIIFQVYDVAHRLYVTFNQDRATSKKKKSARHEDND